MKTLFDNTIYLEQRHKKVSPQPSKAKGDTMKKCNIANCQINKIIARGYCNKHYLQMQRHGKVFTNTIYDCRTAIIENDIAKLLLGIDAKDGYAIVDKDNYILDKYNWSISVDKYPQTNVNGKMIKLHKLILPRRDGYVIDHINRNRLDNRMCNLRHVNIDQNSWNSSLSKRNTTGYKGVKYHKINKNWNARIGSKHIGTYKTALEAAKAYNKAALEIRGKFAVLNVVDN